MGINSLDTPHSSRGKRSSGGNKNVHFPVDEGIRLNRAQRRKLYHLKHTKKGRQILRQQERLRKMWEKVIPSSSDGENLADFRAPEISEIPTGDGEVVNKENQ